MPYHDGRSKAKKGVVDFLPNSGERLPTADELQRQYEASLRRAREQGGAAPTTVEALMWGFRTKGIAHLQEPNCLRRLSELSTAQLREVIKRLIYCRESYPGRDPGISDELLLKLEELR
jgi:hypothetical protein